MLRAFVLRHACPGALAPWLCADLCPLLRAVCRVLWPAQVHLEAARALQFTEEEFMKTLDMGTA